MKGEAVTVDLGEGKYLFALLRYVRNPEYIENLATRSLYNTTKRVWVKEAFRRVVTSQKTIVVPRKLYPLLATFEDVKDPKTVKEVNPDNLAASFGEGYRLKAITLDITDEPVTTGKVKKVLEWLGLYPEPSLGPYTNRTNNIPFYLRVTHGSFLRR